MFFYKVINAVEIEQKLDALDNYLVRTFSFDFMGKGNGDMELWPDYVILLRQALDKIRTPQP